MCCSWHDNGKLFIGGTHLVPYLNQGIRETLFYPLPQCSLQIPLVTPPFTIPLYEWSNANIYSRNKNNKMNNCRQLMILQTRISPSENLPSSTSVRNSSGISANTELAWAPESFDGKQSEPNMETKTWVSVPLPLPARHLPISPPARHPLRAAHPIHVPCCLAIFFPWHQAKHS